MVKFIFICAKECIKQFLTIDILYRVHQYTHNLDHSIDGMDDAIGGGDISLYHHGV